MPINADKPHLWKADVERSIDFYNDWFVKFAPETFRTQRQRTSREVLAAFDDSTFLKEEPAPLGAKPTREERRLALQHEIDAAKSANERNKAG